MSIIVEETNGLAMLPAFSLADEDLFERRIRPVLVETCLPCHGGKKTEANLRLDLRWRSRASNRGGPAIVAGKPEERFRPAATLAACGMKCREDF